MSELRIVEEFELPLPVHDAYAFLISPPAYETFVGWGPIPGIERLDWQQGDSSVVGSSAIVHNKDGSTHMETVTVTDPPNEYAIRIENFSSAFRFLVSGARESWVLSSAGEATHVHRTFVFTMRSVLLHPIGLAVAAMFRKAVRVNHAAMLAHLVN